MISRLKKLKFALFFSAAIYVNQSNALPIIDIHGTTYSLRSSVTTYDDVFIFNTSAMPWWDNYGLSLSVAYSIDNYLFNLRSGNAIYRVAYSYIPTTTEVVYWNVSRIGNQVTLSGPTANTGFGNYVYAVKVPEPSTISLSLMGLGIIGLFATCRQLRTIQAM